MWYWCAWSKIRISFNLHLLLPPQINTWVYVVDFFKQTRTEILILGCSEPLWATNPSEQRPKASIPSPERLTEIQRWYSSPTEPMHSTHLLSQWDVGATTLHLMIKTCFNSCLGSLSCKMHYSSLHVPLQLESSPSDQHYWRKTKATSQSHLTQARTLTAAKNMNQE